MNISKEKKINHRVVLRVHKIFKELLAGTAKFFNCDPDGLMLFTFSTNKDTHLVKIKFRKTHKVIKIFVPIDLNADQIETQCLLKTANIVRDIDRLYSIKSQEYIPVVDMKKKLENLYLWGITEIKRDNEIYTATAVKFCDMHDEHDKEHTLFYGVIEHVERNQSLLQKLLGTCKGYTLHCVDGTEFEFASDDRILETLRPGRLYIRNSLNHHTVMPFPMAAHHMTFTERDRRQLRSLSMNQPGETHGRQIQTAVPA